MGRAVRDDEKEPGGRRWGLLSVLSVTFRKAADSVPNEAHALVLGKIPWPGAITTGLLKHPKWARNTRLKE